MTSDPEKVLLHQLKLVLRVAIARGEQLGYADEDYRKWLAQLEQL